MAKKKREEAHGGHGWFVTFADLMALLLAFFVMLVAFSTQDKQKLKIVAGSMRAGMPKVLHSAANNMFREGLSVTFSSYTPRGVIGARP